MAQARIKSLREQDRTYSSEEQRLRSDIEAYTNELKRLQTLEATYLEVRQCADGNFTSTDRFQGYNRPIAVYAFAEAYNITGEDGYGEYTRRSSEYLTEIQNELGPRTLVDGIGLTCRTLVRQ